MVLDAKWAGRRSAVTRCRRRAFSAARRPCNRLSRELDAPAPTGHPVTEAVAIRRRDRQHDANRLAAPAPWARRALRPRPPVHRRRTGGREWRAKSPPRMVWGQTTRPHGTYTVYRLV